MGRDEDDVDWGTLVLIIGHWTTTRSGGLWTPPTIETWRDFSSFNERTLHFFLKNILLYMTTPYAYKLFSPLHLLSKYYPVVIFPLLPS